MVVALVTDSPLLELIRVAFTLAIPADVCKVTMVVWVAPAKEVDS